MTNRLSAGRMLLQRYRRDQGGATILEFALMVPILVIILFGLLEVAVVTYIDIMLNTAVAKTSYTLSPYANSSVIAADIKTRVAERGTFILDPQRIHVEQAGSSADLSSFNDRMPKYFNLEGSRPHASYTYYEVHYDYDFVNPVFYYLVGEKMVNLTRAGLVVTSPDHVPDPYTVEVTCSYGAVSCSYDEDGDPYDCEQEVTCSSSAFDLTMFDGPVEYRAEDNRGGAFDPSCSGLCRNGGAWENDTLGGVTRVFTIDPEDDPGGCAVYEVTYTVGGVDVTACADAPPSPVIPSLASIVCENPMDFMTRYGKPKDVEFTMYYCEYATEPYHKWEDVQQCPDGFTKVTACESKYGNCGASAAAVCSVDCDIRKAGCP